MDATADAEMIRVDHHRRSSARTSGPGDAVRSTDRDPARATSGGRQKHRHQHLLVVPRRGCLLTGEAVTAGA